MNTRSALWGWAVALAVFSGALLVVLAILLVSRSDLRWPLRTPTMARFEVLPPESLDDLLAGELELDEDPHLEVRSYLAGAPDAPRGVLRIIALGGVGGKPGRALAGAEVRLERADGLEQMPAQVTQESGVVVIDGLAMGEDVRVVVQAAGYEPWTGRVTIGADNELRAVLAGAGSVALAGVVKDSEDRPIPGVDLSLRAFEHVLGARTDEEGAFRIEGVPQTAGCILDAVKPGKEPHRLRLDLLESRTVNIVLKSARTLHVTVTIPALTPVLEAIFPGTFELFVEGKSAGPRLLELTGGQGTTTFPDPGGEVLQGQVTLQAGGIALATGTAVATSEEDRIVRFRFDDVIALRARILGPDGPVRGQLLQCLLGEQVVICRAGHDGAVAIPVLRSEAAQHGTASFFGVDGVSRCVPWNSLLEGPPPDLEIGDHCASIRIAGASLTRPVTVQRLLGQGVSLVAKDEFAGPVFHVPPGTYEVVGWDGIPLGDPVTVSCGDAISFAIPGDIWSGRVTGKCARSGDIQLEAVPAGSRPGVPSRRVGQGERFTFEHVPEGRYRLLARFAAAAAVDLEIDVVAGRTTHVGELGASNRFEARLIDADDAGVPGAEVTLRVVPDGSIPSVLMTTGDDGGFSFEQPTGQAVILSAKGTDFYFPPRPSRRPVLLALPDMGVDRALTLPVDCGVPDRIEVLTRIPGGLRVGPGVAVDGGRIRMPWRVDDPLIVLLGRDRLHVVEALGGEAVPDQQWSFPLSSLESGEWRISVRFLDWIDVRPLGLATPWSPVTRTIVGGRLAVGSSVTLEHRVGQRIVEREVIVR
jgi:hypothetical protein